MSDYLLIFVIILMVGLAIYPLRHMRVLCGVLFLLISAIICGIYWYCGSWNLWHESQRNLAQQAKVRKILASKNGVQEILLRLTTHLKTHPEDARGWFLLGRLYMNQENWQSAYNAFKHAFRLSPTDEKIILNYVRSAAILHHQRLNTESIQLLNDVLTKNPDQPDALMLLASDAYTRHQYQLAITHLQHLLHVLPQDSAEAKNIRQLIAKAFNEK